MNASRHVTVSLVLLDGCVSAAIGLVALYLFTCLWFWIPVPSVFGPRISYFDGPDFDTSFIGILQEAYFRLDLRDVLLLKNMFPSYLPGGIWFYL